MSGTWPGILVTFLMSLIVVWNMTSNLGHIPDITDTIPDITGIILDITSNVPDTVLFEKLDSGL